MSIVKEDIDKLNALLKVSIAKDEYLPEVKKSLKNLSKQMDIKGFRKGNVPVSIVKKRYGNQVLAEEINKILEKQVGDYLKESKLEILGSPVPKEDQNPGSMSLETADDLEFVYELGLAPDFEVKAIEEKGKVVKQKIKVEDKQIDEEVERIKKQFGETENPEKGIEKEDFLEFKLEELDENEHVLEGGLVVDKTILPVEVFKSDKLQKKILDLKVGDQLNVNVFEDIDKEKEEIKKDVLKLEEEAPEAMGDNFRFTLNQINHKVPAELNQELFDKLFGEGKVKSEEELRNKIKEEIAQAFDQASTQKLNQDIFQLLIDETDIELPEAFLKKWIKLSNEKPITDEQIENEFDNFAQNLKWSLISNKLAKAGAVKVTEEEVKEFAKKSILQQFGMGAGQMEDEQLESLAETLVLKNQEQSQKIYQQLNEQKLFEYIREQMDPKEKEITLDEFKKLDEDKS